MRQMSWQGRLGIVLILLTLFLYLAQVVIFRDARNTIFYLFQDMAFLPLQVLLVTMIINRFLTEREKRSMLHKLNMVIGAFFSEMGTVLLRSLTRFDREPTGLSGELAAVKDWPDRKFAAERKALREREYSIGSEDGDLESLKSFLTGKRNFLLRLIENPNLLEHQAFTELLWAVFHLTDELAHRDDLRSLPQSDYDHLSGDIKRAYALLAGEWLAYLAHLKHDYPYLYSLAVRTNPFDAGASVVVK